MFGFAAKHNDKVIRGVIPPILVVMMDLGTFGQWPSINTLGNEDMLVNVAIDGTGVTRGVDHDVPLWIGVAPTLPPGMVWPLGRLGGAFLGAVLTGLSPSAISGLGGPHKELSIAEPATEGNLPPLEIGLHLGRKSLSGVVGTHAGTEHSLAARAGGELFSASDVLTDRHRSSSSVGSKRSDYTTQAQKPLAVC